MKIAELYSEVEKSMNAAIESFKSSSGRLLGLASVNTELISAMVVEAYEGSSLKLGSVASINKLEPSVLSVTPWDGSTLKSIRSSIDSSGLGISTQVLDGGKSIILKFPPITVEYKQGILKNIKKDAEKIKVSLRNSRRLFREKAKEMEKKSEISKDDLESTENKIQKLLDKYIEELDSFLEESAKKLT